MSPVGSVGPQTRGKVKEVSCNLVIGLTTSATSTISESLSATGDVVEVDSKYTYIDSLTSVGSKFAYRAFLGKNQNISVVVYDGKEISDKETMSVSDLKNIGNKLAYLVTERKGEKQFIVYDGKEIGRQCKFITAPQGVGGKLAYNCTKANSSAVMILNGIELPHEKRYGLDSDTYPVDINGKMAYQVVDTGDDDLNWKAVILLDGVDTGLKVYASMPQIMSINGKIAFFAGKLPDNVERVVVYDGIEIQKEGVMIDRLFGVNGKLGYHASKGRDGFTFYDGKIFTTDTSDKGEPFELNHKLAYSITKGRKRTVMYEGKEIGKEYDNIVSGPIVVGGRFVYLALKDKKNFFVTEKI